MQRLRVSKRVTQKFDTESFKLKEMKVVDSKEEHHQKVSQL
jgi:hypothetical protein